MDIEQQLRRLRAMSTFQTFLLVLFAIAWLGGVALDRIGYTGLRWSRSGDTLSVRSMSDGPYVLTHVVAYGSSEDEKRWASLPEPLAIVDSEGGTIDLGQLQWRDLEGKRSDAPTDQRIEVFYVVPQRAGPR